MFCRAVSMQHSLSSWRIRPDTTTNDMFRSCPYFDNPEVKPQIQRIL